MLPVILAVVAGGAVLGAAASLISAYVRKEPVSWRAVLAGAASGAIVGGVGCAAVLGGWTLLPMVAAGAATGLATTALSSWIMGTPLGAKDLVVGGITGAVTMGALKFLTLGGIGNKILGPVVGAIGGFTVQAVSHGWDWVKSQFASAPPPPPAPAPLPVSPPPVAKIETPPPAPAKPVRAPEPLVAYGATGDSVKRVQAVVGTKVDGIFGPKTLAAVRKFQRENKLTVDGMVGPQTWGAIDAKTAPPAPLAPVVSAPVVSVPVSSAPATTVAAPAGSSFIHDAIVSTALGAALGLAGSLIPLPAPAVRAAPTEPVVASAPSTQVAPVAPAAVDGAPPSVAQPTASPPQVVTPVVSDGSPEVTPPSQPIADVAPPPVSPTTGIARALENLDSGPGTTDLPPPTRVLPDGTRVWEDTTPSTSVDPWKAQLAAIKAKLDTQPSAPSSPASEDVPPPTRVLPDGTRVWEDTTPSNSVDPWKAQLAAIKAKLDTQPSAPSSPASEDVPPPTRVLPDGTRVWEDPTPSNSVDPWKAQLAAIKAKIDADAAAAANAPSAPVTPAADEAAPAADTTPANPATPTSAPAADETPTAPEATLKAPRLASGERGPTDDVLVGVRSARSADGEPVALSEKDLWDQAKNRTGLASNRAPVRLAQKDVLDASAEVNRSAVAGEDLTPDELARLNSILTRRSGTPGFRTTAVAGAPAPEAIPSELAKFFEWYSGARRVNTDPVELAAKSYQWLERIQPFENASAETNRQALDLMLERSGYPAPRLDEPGTPVATATTGSVVRYVAEGVNAAAVVQH
jgi:peptidoglycan hydrolase-like protein with peptidoglycan-binding domain